MRLPGVEVAGQWRRRESCPRRSLPPFIFDTVLGKHIRGQGSTRMTIEFKNVVYRVGAEVHIH